MEAVCKLIRRRSMARGSALARCRVTDPLQIDSHTIPSQHTCHVRWRGMSEVRRQFTCSFGLRCRRSHRRRHRPFFSPVPTTFQATTAYLQALEKEPRRQWSCKDLCISTATPSTLNLVTKKLTLCRTHGFQGELVTCLLSLKTRWTNL